MFVRRILAALVAAAMFAGVAAAQEPMRVRITGPGDGAYSDSIDLPLNKAAVVELPRDARDVLVANPNIADAVIRTPRQVYLLGMTVGKTNVFFFDGNGNEILDLEVSVATDVSQLQSMLDRYIRNGNVRAEAVDDQIVLTGAVESAATADQALKLAQRWVETPESVFSMVSISGNEQVMLKVRVVEMQRTVLKQLGVNIDSTTNFGEFVPPVRAQAMDDTGAPILGPNGNPILEVIQPGRFRNQQTYGTDNGYAIAGRALGGLAAGLNATNFVDGVLQSSISAQLDAFERVGIVRTLAEPNLTAITGEAANFLAGGEFPVPVGRDDEGNILIEFKPFGVGLGFTPLVVSEDRISLKISTEVSELTNQGALTFQGSTVTNDEGQTFVVPGLTIPALNVRRAETTVELPSGGSLVMAGLIQEETRQNLEGLPGVKDIPVLGQLFRSRDYESQETELVVIVTPYLVNPTSADRLQTPADGYRTAPDANTILLGQLNRVYKAPGADVEGQAWRGPYGYVME